MQGETPLALAGEYSIIRLFEQAEKQTPLQQPEKASVTRNNTNAGKTEESNQSPQGIQLL
jgi:hypothetical protein